MGIFDDLLKNKNKVDKTSAEKLLDYFKAHDEIEDREAFIKVLTDIINGNYLQNSMSEEDLCRVISEISEHNRCVDCIDNAKVLYDIIVFNREDRDQIELFHKFFKISLKSNLLLANINDFEVIYNLFNNKQLALALYSFSINSPRSWLPLKNYAKEVRQYYVDEEAFFAAIIKVSEKLQDSASFNYNDIVKDAIREDRNSAGLYDIDEAKIIALANKVNKIGDQINSLEILEKNLDEKFSKIDVDLNSQTRDIIDDATKDFRVLYKNSLEEIKEILRKTQNKEDNITRKIENLGDKYIERINILLNINPEARQQVIEGFDGSPTYSEILSSKHSLKDKRNMVSKKMRKSGEIYHITFDRIMKYVLLGKPVMLVGPSGSGKTYTVEQIARLLDLPLYNFGFIADEFAAIKGYNDAQGNFVKTPFYDCLKYGGICFYDEADNSEARAFMEINKVVGSSGYNPYLFPNGEIVNAHPNFRIIATANTWGDGADTIHSTREKLDGATLNRFERIYYDYDQNLEQGILKKYQDIYDFAIAYRKAITERNFDKIISTRDLSDICEYLDSGEFTLEEIIESKFINGLRLDSLSGISSDIESYLNSSNPAFSKFNDIINGAKVKVK